jgi:hypothetical protein
MSYQAFKNDTLSMLYENIRAAVAADRARKTAGKQTHFPVRETPNFEERADALEVEMVRRAMTFEPIDWS